MKNLAKQIGVAALIIICLFGWVIMVGCAIYFGGAAVS